METRALRRTKRTDMLTIINTSRNRVDAVSIGRTWLWPTSKKNYSNRVGELKRKAQTE